MIKRWLGKAANIRAKPPSSDRSVYHGLTEKLTMLSHSADYELVVRQQPNEALVTLPGREKSKPPDLKVRLLSMIANRGTVRRQKTDRSSTDHRAESDIQ